MKKKLFSIWILLFICSSSPLYADTIVLGFNEGPETRAYRLSAEICRAIGEKMGRTITLDSLPLKRSMDMVSRGIIHGEFVRIGCLEKEYPQLIKITEPVGEAVYYVYSQSVRFKVDEWNSLKPYTIVYLRGTYYIEKNAAVHNITTHPVDTYEQAFKSIRAGRSDLFVSTKFSADWYRKNPDFKNIKRLHPSLARVKFHTYFHKKHADLAERYLKALVEVKQQGIMEKIINNAIEQSEPSYTGEGKNE